jgi:beta-galactosidase
MITEVCLILKANKTIAKMKNTYFLISLVLLSVFILGSSYNKQIKTDNNSRTISFDEGWRFIKENPDGAEDPAFNDSGWRIIDLPHDWSIEDLPGQIPDSIVGPFSKASISKKGTGYTVGGTAWYRKHFTLNKKDKGKTVYLQFDGVYMNSDIWVNGKLIGNHPYGYTSFYYDITSCLNAAGQSNVVSVRVRNEGENARWYSGSGIYRHTWLTLVNPTHIGMWGVYVKTPSVTEKSADINITANLVNSGTKNAPVTVQVQIIDPSGQVVGVTKNNSTVLPGTKTDLNQNISISDPVLWSADNPKLYNARVTVLINNKVTDNLITAFGIRTIKMDAQNGFSINGKNLELKGGCIHHDNGPLGSATIDRAEERKIELLKKAGFNAIRCSHNPPSPYLLDVCDRLGMLVIDELYDIWEKSKISPDDYSKFVRKSWKQDVNDMVIRDRNHPSIIMWSIGNEVPEAADTSGFRIAKNLTNEVRALDPTRAVTEALVDVASVYSGKSSYDKQASNMSLLDAVGMNYSYRVYEQEHEKYPNRIMYATETFPYLSLENYEISKMLPYVIGNFIWTAMDYMGEAALGYPQQIPIDFSNKSGARPGAAFQRRTSWPIFNAFSGSIDLIGNPKAHMSYQKVVWGDSKVEMLVHRPVPKGKKEVIGNWGFPDELKSWTWSGYERENMQVDVYTRCDQVRLELNGKNIGEQSIDKEKSVTDTFYVPYEEGILTARCYENGVETASETLKTVGAPASIRLTADRIAIKADRNDLAYIMTEVVDADGNVIPWADDFTINFEISGNGKLAGVGNGNPGDMASFQQPRRKTYQGKCLAIIRPEVTPGKITIKATSEGLKECSLELTVK